MTAFVRTRRAAGAFGAALLALASCASGSGAPLFGGADFLSQVYVDSSYRPNRVNFSTAGGALVEVYANETVDPAAVAAVLSLPARFAPRAFEAVPAGDPALREETNRFVLVLGAPIGSDGTDACRGRVASTTEEPMVLIAFCDGADRISEGRLFTATAMAPSDPAFGRAVRIALAELLPPYDPNNRGESPLFVPG